jgi:hypothetical protein
MGRLIPAGTGLMKYKTLQAMATDESVVEGGADAAELAALL